MKAIKTTESWLRKLITHEGFIRYAKNSSWLIAEKFVRLFVSLIVGIWIARYLGPEKFGLLSYAQSFVFMFSAIASLGLEAVLVRELVKGEVKYEVLLGTSYVLKLLAAIFTIPLLYLAVTVANIDSYTIYLIFIIATAMIFQSFNVIDYYYQSRVLSKYVASANTMSLAISSVVKIYLITTSAPLEMFACMAVIEIIILVLGLIYHYVVSSGLRLRRWKFDLKVAKGLLEDSWPMILSGIVVSVYMRLDQVMIKSLLGDRAVGEYSAAVRISEAWYFIPMVITNSVFPAIINIKKNKALYKLRLMRLYALMAWIAIGVAIPMTFLSDWIVMQLYGAEYDSTSAVLKLHIWAGIFVFLGVASGNWYISENLQMMAFIRTFVGVIVNIVLNILLIPRYGVEGAAFATLVSYFIAGFMFDAILVRTRETFIMKVKAIFLRGIW